jgi:glutathione S-transferase
MQRSTAHALNARSVTVVAHVRQGEHKQPPFLEVNPFGKLPAVKCDDGTPVFESGAILLYIAEKYSGLNTAEQRARAAQWVLFANATFSPAMFNSQQRAQQMPQLCDALDAVLSKNKFLLGDHFTVADAAVGAYLAYTCMFFPDVSFKVRARSGGRASLLARR